MLAQKGWTFTAGTKTLSKANSRDVKREAAGENLPGRKEGAGKKNMALGRERQRGVTCSKRKRPHLRLPEKGPGWFAGKERDCYGERGREKAQIVALF